MCLSNGSVTSLIYSTTSRFGMTLVFPIRTECTLCLIFLLCSRHVFSFFIICTCLAYLLRNLWDLIWSLVGRACDEPFWSIQYWQTLFVWYEKKKKKKRSFALVIVFSSSNSQKNYRKRYSRVPFFTFAFLKSLLLVFLIKTRHANSICFIFFFFE